MFQGIRQAMSQDKTACRLWEVHRICAGCMQARQNATPPLALSGFVQSATQSHLPQWAKQNPPPMGVKVMGCLIKAQLSRNQSLLLHTQSRTVNTPPIQMLNNTAPQIIRTTALNQPTPGPRRQRTSRNTQILTHNTSWLPRLHPSRLSHHQQP